MATDSDLLKLYGGIDTAAAPAAVPTDVPLTNEELVARYSQKEEKPKKKIGDNRAAAVNFLRGIPVAGAYADNAAAALNAAAQPVTETGLSSAPNYLQRYNENLQSLKQGTDEYTEKNPLESIIGQGTAGVASMLPLGATALGARGLGLVGTLGERTLFGGLSGTSIGAADSAARSGGDLSKTKTGGEIGGAIGALSPLAGRAIGAGVDRMMSGPMDRASQALLQRAEQLGIPIRPAQASTSPFINKLDQMIGKVPGSGMGALTADQHAGFNRALARTMGEDAHAITTDVMAAARRRIGGEFDHVERNTTVNFDQPLATRLYNIAHDASSVLEPGQITPLARRINEIAGLAQSGQFDGRTFNNMLKKDAPLSRLQKNADPNISHYANQIRGALQDALERSAMPEMAQRYATARMQYRNMKTIQPLAEKAPTGDISPLLLAGQVRRSNPNFAFGTGGDIADIARIGQRYMRQPPDSGTPLGTMILNMGLGAVPALAAGGAGYAGGDVMSGLGGLLGAAALARGSNRFMNNPAMLEHLISRAPYAAVPVKNQLQTIQGQ